MRVGEEKEGAGRRKQGRGAPAPPPPASFPSPITVQEQQKSGESREVQIAEGPYSVLSGGWHGGSQGAYCWEGRENSRQEDPRSPRSPRTACLCRAVR